MECPVCGSELDYEDYCGSILAYQNGYITGGVYRCPNGFDQNGTCGSESFSVPGGFYSYRIDDEIHAEYPCLKGVGS